jgi:hypothetical protein
VSRTPGQMVEYWRATNDENDNYFYAIAL